MPRVIAQAKASTIPATSTSPKPWTIGTGESSRTRKPTAVAMAAVRIVGAAIAPTRAAVATGSVPSRARISSQRDCSWMA